MSAWMTSPRHVAAIVRWYTHNDANGEPDDCIALADMLHKENALSVNYRYPNHPAEMPHRFTLADVNAAPSLSPVEVIKACDCLEYQSCEHPGWKQSRARELVRTIRGAAINALPGYDAAPWGID